MTIDEKLTPEEIDAIDLQDAMDAFIGAMDAIAKAQDHLALGRVSEAQLVLARARMADAGGIEWCEV